MSRFRIILADDHTLLVEAFERLLEPEFDIVATVEDGRALVEATEELHPDVVVVDVGMPRLNGLEAARQIREKTPGVKMVFLTMNEDRDIAAAAFRAGASGYLLKSSAATELGQAIRAAVSGCRYLTPLIHDGDVESLERDGERLALESLTSRQREVLQLLAEGKTMKEVAAELDVTPRTVAFHKYRMMDELGIRTTAELIQYAVKRGVLSA